MAPYELSHVGGAIGIAWLQQIRQRVSNSVWLNPVRREHWAAPSIQMIRHVFPMFELSIDGITEAIDVLRGTRPNRPLVAATREFHREVKIL